MVRPTAPSAHWPLLRHFIQPRRQLRSLRRGELVGNVKDARLEQLGLGVKIGDRVGPQLFDRVAIDGLRRQDIERLLAHRLVLLGIGCDFRESLRDNVMHFRFLLGACADRIEHSRSALLDHRQAPSLTPAKMVHPRRDGEPAGANHDAEGESAGDGERAAPGEKAGLRRQGRRRRAQGRFGLERDIVDATHRVLLRINGFNAVHGRDVSDARFRAFRQNVKKGEAVVAN
jgi:hypothetical protein